MKKFTYLFFIFMIAGMTTYSQVERSSGVEPIGPQIIVTGYGTPAVGSLSSPTQQVLAYPNPASKELNIALTCKISEFVEVRLMNAVGRVVANENVQINGKTVCTLNVSRLPEGMYFLSIIGKDFKSSQRITIQR